jgi:hypothetical protein
MHKSILLMGYISPKIFSTDNIPSRVIFIIQLFFYISRKLAHFLIILNIRQGHDLFDCLISDADRLTLHIWGHIRGLDGNLFRIFFVHNF